MSLTATQPEGGEFELVSPGTKLGICYSIVDIGDQKSTYNGVESVKPKVVLSFELPHEKLDDGRPMIISAYVTNSLNENAILRKHLESWRGKAFTDEELKGFDLLKVLGVPCLLSVIHDSSSGKTYANIENVSGIMKGMEIPPRYNDLISYDMDKPDATVFDKLPSWLQEKITIALPASSGQAQRHEIKPPPADEFDDDIPF